MNAPVYTESMRSHAELLLARAHLWTRGYRKRDGLAFVVFPSSRAKNGSNAAYYATETACSCPSWQHRSACSHQLAVAREADRAREAAARKPVSKYAILAGCSARNCDNDRESGDSRYCSDHVLVEAFG